MNAKQVLDLFEAATENKTEAIDDLCLKFDQETEFGEKMDDYNKLLDIVISHIKRSHTTVQTKNMGRGGFA